MAFISIIVHLDLLFPASVVFLDISVGYCYRVRCPFSSPSVGHITVGVIILEATVFGGLDVQLEFLFYLENFVSCPVVDHIAVGAAVLEAAESKSLDVLPETRWSLLMTSALSCIF